MRFKTIVIVQNPISTHSKRADKFVSEVRRLNPDASIHIAETIPGGRAANQKLLDSYKTLLGADTLICIGGGDGTVRMVVDLLYASRSPKALRSVILPLWGGNANDLAYMLNGQPRIKKLEQVFAKGRPVAIKPLICRLTDSSGATDRQLATSYISFGAIAEAAHALNDDTYRQSVVHTPGGRQLRETLTVVNAFLRSQRFMIEEDAKGRLVYEHLILNGSRLAKVPRTLLSITDEEFVRITVDNKRLSSAIFRSVELLHQGSLKQKTATETAFTVRGNVWAQFDGEAVRLGPTTKVEITIGPKPFYALSIKD